MQYSYLKKKEKEKENTLILVQPLVVVYRVTELCYTLGPVSAQI